MIFLISFQISELQGGYEAEMVWHDVWEGRGSNFNVADEVGLVEPQKHFFAEH